jgi:hypothetical protein
MIQGLKRSARGFRNRDRPASYSITGATTNWTSGAYAYDGAGNVAAIGANGYLYDPVSRLSSATQYTGAASGTGAIATQSAAYDVYGNITSLTTDGAGLTTTTSASTNRLTGATYDSAGSMTWWNGNTYAYEPLGMTRNIVASGVETVHIYTADDERAWTYQSGAPSRWTLRDLDGKVLRELKNDAGTWSAERAYVHRDGALLAAITPTETVHFHPDHLGTPRLITGTGGALSPTALMEPPMIAVMEPLGGRRSGPGPRCFLSCLLSVGKRGLRGSGVAVHPCLP